MLDLKAAHTNRVADLGVRMGYLQTLLDESVEKNQAELYSVKAAHDRHVAEYAKHGRERGNVSNEQLKDEMEAALASMQSSAETLRIAQELLTRNWGEATDISAALEKRLRCAEACLDDWAKSRRSEVKSSGDVDAEFGKEHSRLSVGGVHAKHSEELGNLMAQHSTMAECLGTLQSAMQESFDRHAREQANTRQKLETLDFLKDHVAHLETSLSGSAADRGATNERQCQDLEELKKGYRDVLLSNDRISRRLDLLRDAFTEDTPREVALPPPGKSSIPMRKFLLPDTKDAT